MQKKIWYGYSQSDNRTCFFDSKEDLDNYSQNLTGTGDFTVNGEIQGLNIEHSSSSSSRQTERV